jgi:hypothetical protein
MTVHDRWNTQSGDAAELLYSNDTLTAFPDGFTGDAINASGQVAGSESGGAAGIYANGTATALPTPKPFGLTENGWAGLGINDNGDVVVVYYGRLDIPSLYINGTLTGIPPLCGEDNQAQAINDSGQITGASPSPTQGCDWLRLPATHSIVRLRMPMQCFARGVSCQNATSRDT